MYSFNKYVLSVSWVPSILFEKLVSQARSLRVVVSVIKDKAG